MDRSLIDSTNYNEDEGDSEGKAKYSSKKQQNKLSKSIPGTRYRSVQAESSRQSKLQAITRGQLFARICIDFKNIYLSYPHAFKITYPRV